MEITERAQENNGINSDKSKRRTTTTDVKIHIVYIDKRLRDGHKHKRAAHEIDIHALLKLTHCDASCHVCVSLCWCVCAYNNKFRRINRIKIYSLSMLFALWCCCCCFLGFAFFSLLNKNYSIFTHMLSCSVHLLVHITIIIICWCWYYCSVCSIAFLFVLVDSGTCTHRHTHKRLVAFKSYCLIRISRHYRTTCIATAIGWFLVCMSDFCGHFAIAIAAGILSPACFIAVVDQQLSNELCLRVCCRWSLHPLDKQYINFCS